MSVDTTEYIPPFERPLRVPKNVPLTHAEPGVARSGQSGTWALSFRLGRTVDDGEPLAIEVHGHRNSKGAVTNLQTDRPGEAGYVSAMREDGSELELTARDKGYIVDVAVPEGGIPKGETIRVTIGDAPGGATLCDAWIPNKFFTLFVLSPDEWNAPDWTGGGMWTLERQGRMVAVCLLHILGGPVERLRAYLPADATPGEEIVGAIHPQDAYTNPAGEMPDGLEVSIGDAEVTLERIEKSNALRVRFRAPGEGVHRLKVRWPARGIETESNPMVVRAEAPERRLFWGMIHGHTEMSDGTGPVDNYFRQMRDDARLDFGALGDHDHLWETPDAYWKITCDATKRWHEPGRFVTLLGYEWAKWTKRGDADRNVYFLEDDRPMVRSDEENYPRPWNLFEALKDEEAIVIPHHPACGGNFCDWSSHDGEKERLVEIHQMRGSYEFADDALNPFPQQDGTGVYQEGFVNVGLRRGWRVGFTGGGDDHLGLGGTDHVSHDVDGLEYYAGQTGVWAESLTREAIFRALQERRTVATSGPRMILEVTVNGRPIGSEWGVSADPSETRTVRARFEGTAPLRSIDVIRNGEIVHSTSDAELNWTDREPLDGLWLDATEFSERPFVYYYVRAIQQDGQTAWASPIWIEKDM